MHIVDTILNLFRTHGQGLYFGEAVTETEHALQTANLARVAGADDELVAAALLHDVGHLLHGLPEDIAERGIDARHEDGGAFWLERYFGPAVTVPVRLHVAAKRYLCAAEAGYLAGLSPASQRSLELQGGPFDAESARQFEQQPHAREAVALRRWDDTAKVPGLVVPDLEAYRPVLAAVLARGGKQA